MNVSQSEHAFGDAPEADFRCSVVELDDGQLQSVVGGSGPTGGWSFSADLAAGPTQGW